MVVDEFEVLLHHPKKFPLRHLLQSLKVPLCQRIHIHFVCINEKRVAAGVGVEDLFLQFFPGKEAKSTVLVVCLAEFVEELIFELHLQIRIKFLSSLRSFCPLFQVFLAKNIENGPLGGGNEEKRAFLSNYHLKPLPRSLLPEIPLNFS